MNIKEYLVPLSLAMLTVWGLQFFWGDRVNDKGVQSGQTFVAPEKELACKPLNKDVDFVDTKRSAEEKETEVETKNALFTFSTNGGSLQRLEFKRKQLDHTLTTIFPVSEYEREDACFLVGLQEKTPYYYEFVGSEDHDGQYTVTYRAETDEALIEKQYRLYDATYKVDLTLRVVPKYGKEIQPRIFYPAPFLPGSQKSEQISAIYNNQKGKVKKTLRDKVNAQQGWLTPTLFGADDRYFVNAMVADHNNFTKRAYYKISGNHGFFSILEGASVDQETSWDISFYFGPKEEAALVAVDPRLEQALDYSGLLKPLATLLLYVLMFFYAYLKNYGLAIIALTILVKLLLLPFTFNAEQRMKKPNDFNKKLQYLQQKYKNDPQRLAHERAELFKKQGLPGLGGCLPLLLQMPIFYTLTRILSSSINLYEAPFYLWIKNLSAPDPYYVLPLLLMLSMLLHAATADKNQRTTLLVMAFVFGAITANLPAGLGLYILTNTFLSVGQTALAKRFAS